MIIHVQELVPSAVFARSPELTSVPDTMNAAEPAMASVPFRLLDLPQELQDKVYSLLYAETYDVAVTIAHNRDPRELLKPHIFTLNNIPSYAIELACKKTREDTHLIRRNAFNGQLSITLQELSDEISVGELCANLPFWLRTHVTSLTIGPFIESTTTEGDSTVKAWTFPNFLLHFPRVKVIQVNCERAKMYKRHPTRLSNTDEWNRLMAPNAYEVFHSGQRDYDFWFPAYALGLIGLASTIEERTDECQVCLETTRLWMNDIITREHMGIEVSLVVPLVSRPEQVPEDNN